MSDVDRGASAPPPNEEIPRLVRQPRDERLDVLARMLRDRPGRSATWIAEDFDVSVRTVRRDIAMLRARGTPVAGARGRTGGLRLHPEWGLSRVQLSTADALGALVAMTIVEQMRLDVFPESVRRAYTAVVAAFPYRDRRGSSRCARASSWEPERPQPCATPMAHRSRQRSAPSKQHSWSSA